MTYNPKPSFFRSVSKLLECTRMHFRQINSDRCLAEEDKRRLKEFYLQNLVAPRAKRILEKLYPEEFKCTESTSQPGKTPQQEQTS